MGFQPWKLGAMEEHGHTSTSQGRINRVARYLVGHTSGDIDAVTFERACASCGIDPHSFRQSDIDEIQKKINKI